MGVFKIDAKAEAAFLSGLGELLGRRLSVRVYYKEVHEQPGESGVGSVNSPIVTSTSLGSTSPLIPKSKSEPRRIILTHFIRHNPNSV